MILIDDTVISEDVADEFFVCDLSKCKGACCVEGDLGAPLEEDELAIIESIQEQIAPYLSEEGKAVIEKVGTWVKDEDGDFSTPVIEGRECVYAIYDDKKYLKCGIEQAFFDGKIDFRKPISCHLYPIRIAKLAEYQALNYDRWSICSDACSHGKQLGVPIYKFLKEPLIRKFGDKWYSELEKEIEERKEEK
ncbi:hypothetical protein HME7025_01666 [Aquirufa nivalisilvae]|uniref:DUF3109 family protein n=1 Tax=Aquirufa nivalisilvae TaxID=2516557 RepID=A0A2S2DVV2_9BACT|nr:DUF3109 family protein [Aquirufa nivalisilvae]AWL09518.1 hypothetical protein HME7025_01666 [Aquirufa nivalisilvae]